MITDDIITLENFVATVNINNETGYQVTLPLQGERIRIDWGDENTEIITTANSNYATVSHTYENDGIYYIKAIASSISNGGCGNSLNLIEVSVLDLNIGNFFCQNCTNLTLLQLAGDISSIGSNFCNGCSNLSAIFLTDTIQNIGTSFCAGCSSLTSIKLPNQLTYLDYGFCNGCSNLKNIDIPSTITSIGGDVFQNCSNLKIDIIMPNVTSVGTNFCRNSGVKRIILNNATNIGTYFCYDCKSIEEVLISPNTSILPYGFCSGCVKLTKFKIPNNIQTINSNALSHTGLYNIEIPNKVTSIGGYFGSECNNLTSIYIPDSVTSIGSRFMFLNSSIAQIRLSNNLESIGEGFCQGASNLEEIVIPKSVTSIGSGFLYNSSVSMIVFEGTTPPEMQHNISQRSIIVPTKESINAYINTPNYPTQTSQYQVNSLSRRIYKVGEKLAWFLTNKNVISKPNEGLTTLANKIDNIYANTPRVIIEDDTVTDFADLRVTFVFPKNCSRVRGRSLSNWKNLKHCILPEGLYNLETSAFNGCSNLVEITIPSTINSIGSSVFADTTSLNKIIFKNTTPPTVNYANAFSNLPTTCTIEVPIGSLKAYKNASNYPDPNVYTYKSLYYVNDFSDSSTISDFTDTKGTITKSITNGELVLTAPNNDEHLTYCNKAKLPKSDWKVTINSTTYNYLAVKIGYDPLDSNATVFDCTWNYDWGLVKINSDWSQTAVNSTSSINLGTAGVWVFEYIDKVMKIYQDNVLKATYDLTSYDTIGGYVAIGDCCNRTNRISELIIEEL